MTSLLLTLLLSFAHASDSSGSYVREQNIALERQTFQIVPFGQEGATMSDATGDDDIVLFDKASGTNVPSAVLDLTEVTFAPQAQGWVATFDLNQPLPSNPQYPINFNLFIDANGNTQDNAPTGVFRAGVDHAYLLLYGQQTKWHALAWTYDAPARVWRQEQITPSYAIADTSVTMLIPYTLLPQTTQGMVRALALTSDNGVIAVDVAPGKGLPAVQGNALAGQAPSAAVSAKPLLSMPVIIVLIVIVILAGVVYVIRRTK